MARVIPLAAPFPSAQAMRPGTRVNRPATSDTLYFLFSENQTVRGRSG